MMQRIRHRGGGHVKTITRPHLTVQVSWSDAETRLASPPLSQNVAWDGVPIQNPAPEALRGWTQPCALAAACERGLFLARGPLGVRPLYYGRNGSGTLAFASEVKALLSFTEDVNEFPPGAWYTPRDGFHRYVEMDSGNLPYADPNRIALELRRRLDQAVARCIRADAMGAWLSGGVDSSVIATLARRHVGTFHSFVSGVKGAPDLAYGEQVASFLGTTHHSLVVAQQDLVAALPAVIYHLESFDALLVRSSVVNYLAAQLASDHVGAVLSGEGGDELFAGYDYIKRIPPSEIPGELEDIVLRLHNTAFQRVDRCAYAHGLVPFVPFADLDVVRYALSIPPEYKVHHRHGVAVEKWILRRAFQGLLPDAVLWRPKAKFWQGAGVATLLAEHAETSVTDADYRRERVLPNGWRLHSKEELLYYRIFREHFGRIPNLSWMGRTKRVSEGGGQSPESGPPPPVT